MASEEDRKRRHPKSSYDAKYPHNKKYVSDSGSEVEFDDTPGKERIRISHGKSGSYVEISANGHVVEMTTAGRTEYIKGGHTFTSDKNSDVKVGGSTRSSVHGDSHSEVKGSSSSQVSGDTKSIVGGDSVSAVKGDAVSGVQGKAVYKYGGGLQLKFDGEKSDHKPVDVKADSAMTMECAKTITVESLEKIIFKVGGSTITMESGEIKIKSSKISLN